jgi:hypothetical protein
MRSVLVLSLTASALAACRDECGCKEAARHEASVEIGTGDAAFAPIENGGIPFVQGPQGGWHVFGAARLTGIAGGEEDTFFDPCLPGFTFDVTAADGSFADVVDETFRYVPTEDGQGDLLGVLVILDVGTASEADGAAVTYALRVEDACGTVVKDEVEGTLRFAGAQEGG